MSSMCGRWMLGGKSRHISMPDTCWHLRFWPPNWWHVSSSMLRSSGKPLSSMLKYDSSSASWWWSLNSWLRMHESLCISVSMSMDKRWLENTCWGCRQLFSFWRLEHGVHFPLQDEVLEAPLCEHRPWHWYTSDASECETHPRNTPTSAGRWELVLVCKELSAVQQPTREHTESVQSIAVIKVMQTQSAGSGC